jgi:UrcA family protein
MSNRRSAMFDRSRNLAVASAFLLAAGPAFAGQGQPTAVVYGQESEDFRTERVSYADLDLATIENQKLLNSRVSGAVKRVCLYRESKGRVLEGDYHLCSNAAWNGARPQIAQAVARAHDVALNGKSSIAAAAITISVR